MIGDGDGDGILRKHGYACLCLFVFLREQTCITHVARLHSELQSSTMPSGPEPSQTAIRPLVLP